MKVIIAKSAGFCEGVKRAVDMAQAVIQKPPFCVYSLGQLVHNIHVVKKLQEFGLKVVERLEEITADGILIISAHGVSPKIVQAAQKKGLKLIDTTCPKVRKVQKLAHELSQKGKLVIIIGDKEHREIKGVIDWADGRALVIENKDEITEIPRVKPLGVIAQTTQSEENFEQITSKLKEMDWPFAIELHNTICQATIERQRETIQLAKQVEIMLAIGDYQSANTRRLVQLSKKTGTETHHIQSVSDLNPLWLREKQSLGLTAGASTPNWIIEEVVKFFNSRN